MAARMSRNIDSESRYYNVLNGPLAFFFGVPAPIMSVNYARCAVAGAAYLSGTGSDVLQAVERLVPALWRLAPTARREPRGIHL